MGGGGGGGGGGGEFTLVLQDAVKPGTVVKKGAVVAEFDRQYMTTRLDDYRASVIQTEANFKQLLANLDVDKQAHNQTIESSKGALDKSKLDMKTLPVLSNMDAERRRLTMEESQARYDQLLKEVKFKDIGLKADRRVAELQVKQSKIELQRAENNVNKMVLKAPIDGLVVMQSMFRGGEFDQIKVGDQLWPGMMFMQIVDTRSMVVNATVSQVDVEKLRLGQRARVRFDAFPGLELPARIYSIGSVGKASRFRADWVKDLDVRLKLEEMDPRVIPDLSASVDVILEETDAPAYVPREAVFRDEAPAGKETKPYVLVRNEAGEWLRREVELGVENNTQVIIKSGVKANEVVALEKPVAVKPGEATRSARWLRRRPQAG